MHIVQEKLVQSRATYQETELNLTNQKRSGGQNQAEALSGRRAKKVFGSVSEGFHYERIASTERLFINSF